MKRPTPIRPKPGQESVWDYPRPPRLASVSDTLRVIFDGQVIAQTGRGYRVLETSHPPVYYFPPSDVNLQYIRHVDGGKSFCEWKGEAFYVDVVVKDRVLSRVGWGYSNPTADFLPIKGYLAFYAGPMEACYVGEEKVIPQPGSFYGGWITSNIVGPFKGEEGSWGW